jgi:hypothetical protein
MRALARKFGSNLHVYFRHSHRHMSVLMKAQLAAKAHEAGESELDLERFRIEESNGLLQRIAWARAKAYQLFDTAERVEDVRAGVIALNAIHANLSLTAKVLGEIGAHSVRITQNLVISKDYLALRGQLLNTLRQFPEARAAVLATLRDAETAPIEIKAAQNGSPTAESSEIASDSPKKARKSVRSLRKRDFPAEFEPESAPATESAQAGSLTAIQIAQGDLFGDAERDGDAE